MNRREREPLFRSDEQRLIQQDQQASRTCLQCGGAATPFAGGARVLAFLERASGAERELTGYVRDELGIAGCAISSGSWVTVCAQTRKVQ